MKKIVKYRNYETNCLSNLWFKGDQLAFETLFERYYGKAIVYMLKLTKGNRMESEDLVQDMFTKIYEKTTIERKAIKKFEEYLFSGLKNNFIDKRRTEQSRKEKRLILTINSPLSINGSQFETEDFLEKIEERLTEKQVKVFKLHNQGHSNKEIAKKTKIGNANSIGSILNRAKKKIKEIFGEKLKSEFNS